MCEWFQVNVRLRQGCVMDVSIWLFNGYMDGAVREVRGEERAGTAEYE